MPMTKPAPIAPQKKRASAASPSVSAIANQKQGMEPTTSNREYIRRGP
jgi:hypothetical protein